MNDPAYLKTFACLPKPTEDQYANFAKHLPQAHSWYKHLPFIDGKEFVLYLNPDAGNPHMQLSPRYLDEWREQTDYTRPFGYLDYYCPTEKYPGPLDAEFRAPFTFIWYPWIMPENWRLFYDTHYSEISRLANEQHPEGEEIRLLASEIRTLARWDAEEERKRSNVPQETFDKLNLSVCEKLDKLAARELAKFRAALQNLRTWLENGCP